MANALYDFARESFLAGDIDWINDDIIIVLCSTTYTPDIGNDQYYSDIPAGARVAVSSPLSSKTVANGVADAADVTFPTVSGDQINYIVFVKDTGVEATSTLIALFDNATNLPYTPNGNNIELRFDNGMSRIFFL